MQTDVMPQDIACYVWDLTIKQGELTPDDIHAKFRALCKKYTFQLEKGEETGYMHYQCRVSLAKKARLGTVIELFKDIGAHVNLTSTEGAKSCFYVMKEQTRVEGPWTEKEFVQPRKPLKTVDKLISQGLYPWQQSLIEETSTYDDRRIHVVIDLEGNHGKSSFTKYAWHQLRAQPVPPMQSAEDLIGFVMSLPVSSLYLIDMPRAMKKTKLYGMYSGIETLKNGMLYDKRYHGKFEYIDEPNIIVFTNSPPKMKYLSRDRWALWTIKDNQLVQFHFATTSANSANS